MTGDGGAPSSAFPEKLEQVGEGSLGVWWSDGHRSVYEVRPLRAACRCARCEDERTGDRLVRLEDIPARVRPVEIRPVGRYGLAIRWDDGHDTGIYTFEYLRSLCPCGLCRTA